MISKITFEHPVTQLLLRTLAAVFGGYAFSYGATSALVLLLPWQPPDIVFFSILFPAVFYLVAVLRAFATPTALLAWRDLTLASLLTGGLAVIAKGAFS